jgi:cytochrome c oxidase subunit 2
MLMPRKIPKIEYCCAAGLALVVLVSAGALSGCQQSAAADATRGKELFRTCSSCHGPDGGGNFELGAPSIAGRSAPSIEAELQEFRSGFRGNQFDDREGMRMRPMALSLATDQDVKAVAGYISSLPPVRHPSRLDGDPKAGEALFNDCSTCHGPDGAGDEESGIPRLAGLEDWYVARQLKKFKGGIRGFNPKDDLCSIMQPAAEPLADDKAMRDVAAYIATLQQ